MSATVFSGEPDKPLHEKCIYPTVMVLNEDILGNGSGVIVRSVKVEKEYENYVITCAHILGESEELKNVKILIKIGIYENWSTLVGSKQHSCEIVAFNKQKDIAILKFKSESVVSVADMNLKPELYIGNDVLRIGCGFGEPFRVDYGKITSLDKSVGSFIKNTYRVSIPTIMGDSGGPVYHEGKIIGIAESIRMAQIGSSSSPVPHMCYVIPLARFFELEEFSKHLTE